MFRLLILALGILAMTAQESKAADAKKLEAEAALLKSIEIKPADLMPLRLKTALVKDGRAEAVICHADDAPWREAAATIQKAIAEATGVTLPLKTDIELPPEQADDQNVILVGNLDNNRLVARLYHNFFVCSDVGYTGRTGYEVRSVHDPFGAGHNYIMVGGSFAEGAQKGAQVLADLVKQNGRKGDLVLGRLLQVKFDPKDRPDPPPTPMAEKVRDDTIANGRRLMFSPGQGRSGVGRLIDCGIAFHRTGDPQQGQVYKALMFALLEYYQKDEYIVSEGLGRYDRDFRDAWTHEVAILWDLLEECGLFSDQERLDITNYLIRLGLECVTYQGWYRPASVAKWAANRDIVHNHNTFPALGVLFVGNYMKRHYKARFVDDWLKVAHGIFNGQKHSSKPLEDAAAYQWLPIMHTMVYSLSQGDLTFFEEGHARDSTKVALMVMDNAGYQAAFGDHEALKSASGIATTLRMIGWYYKDPELLWGVRCASSESGYPMGQDYASDVAPRVPLSHVGLSVSYLPRQAYDSSSRGEYGTTPNLPYEQTFDKLAFRAGWDRNDEYMLLDGFGRGNHMHFDANAIISFAKGGEPLLVDGEYIKNAPKYHNSLVIIRDGRAEYAPAVTGLGRADHLDTTSCAKTWLPKYNGAEWTRNIVWRRNDYFLVCDEVRALQAGEYTLRCCWRPWGDASLRDNVLTVAHKPMRLVICNADGAPSRLETMKVVERMPISRWSQQVSLPLKPGDAYRFLNLFHAEPLEQTRDVTFRQVGEGLTVVERPQGRDIVAFGPGVAALPGLRAEADMALLSADRLILAGAKGLADTQSILKASAPVSLELAPAAGAGVLVTSTETEITLRLGPSAHLTSGETNATANAAGDVALKLPTGRHTLKFDAFPMYPAVLAALTEAARPSVARARTENALQAAPLRPAWEYAGFDPVPETLPVASVRASAPPEGRYGPVEKLIDGECSGSTTSVKWTPGVTTTVIAELAEDAQISSVVLREWQMQDNWRIGERKLEISSDGFKQDIRAIPGPFVNVGEQSFGSNVNTLMELKVGQKGRQIRLTLAPAKLDCTVYLAELEIHGVRPGAIPPITACASGDLDGDGRAEIVLASAFGQIQALSSEGKALWTFADKERAAINAIACLDVDGDGKAEVVYGGGGGRLCLLSGQGQPRWQATPPKFRGLVSDVMTIFPADINGDGKPKIVCGCVSWQYFAYDAQGKMIWKNVIYAHSATVGCAADVDGDGKHEIIAGNVYYTLNVIAHTGKRLWNAGSIGPEMTAVAAADVNGDRRPVILTGVDSGDLYCYDSKGQKLWQTNLGDKITRILSVDLDGDKKDEIVCAAESANIFALRGDGTVLWRASLPDGVSDLAVIRGSGPPLFAAAAGSAGVVVIDAAGKPVGAGSVAGASRSLVTLGGRVVATTSEGKVIAFNATGLLR